MRRAIVIFSFFVTFTSQASTIAGADISYKNVGLDSFEITVNVYRDCSGIDFNPSEITIVAKNTCNQPLIYQNLQKVEGPLNMGISTLPQCKTTCSGGNLPGMQKLMYKGIIELPYQCSLWEFGYQSPCCRTQNLNVQNSDSTSLYVRATLNNLAFRNASSPSFTKEPLSSVCSTSSVFDNSFKVNYSNITDTIKYTLVCGYVDSLHTLQQYVSPNTCNLPISDITIDETQGYLRYTTTNNGNYSLCVEINFFDENGIFKGSIMRDTKIEKHDCVPMYLSTTTVTKKSDLILLNQNTVGTCLADTLKFEIDIEKKGYTDSIFVSTNFNAVLVGGSNYYEYLQANHVKFYFKWFGNNLLAENNPFFIREEAERCPINEVMYFTFNIQQYSIDKGVTISNYTLKSNSKYGDYQWFDCDNNQLIAGATNQEFTPLVNGSYAVILNTIGCTDTSACISVNNVDVSENNISSNFTLYPNPTADAIVLQFDESVFLDNLSIYNILGQPILEMQKIVGTQFRFNVSSFPEGLYIVKIRREDEEQRLSFIKM